MKNPFVEMALIAAAMSAAIKENVMRSLGAAGFGMSKHRTRFSGPRNPAGSKLIRKFYRNKHGSKGTLKEAVEWRATIKAGWL